MSDIKRDQRKIGGNRVFTSFIMEVENPDPFNTFSGKLVGTIVFNVRGGCIFVKNSGIIKAYSRIFVDGPVASIDALELKIPDQDAVVLEKLQIKSTQQKDVSGREGIVFKFLQSTEQQLDQLNHLVGILPAVDSDEEVINQLKASGE